MNGFEENNNEQFFQYFDQSRLSYIELKNVEINTEAIENNKFAYDNDEDEADIKVEMNQ